MWCHMFDIKFVNGKNVKNEDFIVSSDDGSTKFRSGRFIRLVLEDINKLAIKIFAIISDLSICYYLKTSLTSTLERLFLQKFIE